jgi:hypothetical protein
MLCLVSSGFLLGLFCDPEDGGGMSVQNISRRRRSRRRGVGEEKEKNEKLKKEVLY